MQTLLKIARAVIERPVLRTIVQTSFSILLLAFLLYFAREHDVLARLQSLEPAVVISVVMLYVVGYFLNTRRWQILLAHYQVHQRFLTLLGLYFVGLFCSIFLPTGTGGDAVRVYDVARRSGKTVQTIIATLQERLFGLGSSMLIGLVATFAFLTVLPQQLQLWALLLQSGGILLTAFLLYPAPLVANVVRVWQSGNNAKWQQRIQSHPLFVRVGTALHPIAQLPALPFVTMMQLLVVTLSASLMGVAAYYVLGQALGVPAGFMVYCLAVPLVWIIRMVPISLGGIGVSEGSFVFLMGLFGVTDGSALALALGVLTVQTTVTLVGGVILAIHMLRGSQILLRQPKI